MAYMFKVLRRCPSCGLRYRLDVAVEMMVWRMVNGRRCGSNSFEAGDGEGMGDDVRERDAWWVSSSRYSFQYESFVIFVVSFGRRTVAATDAISTRGSSIYFTDPGKPWSESKSFGRLITEKL